MNETTQPTANTRCAAESRTENLKTAYEQLCKSYESIDSFRYTLLGLLPAASAGGIFLLLNKTILGDNAASGAGKADSAHAVLQSLSGPIGLFGVLITLGFFAFEVYGI